MVWIFCIGAVISAALIGSLRITAVVAIICAVGGVASAFVPAGDDPTSPYFWLASAAFVAATAGLLRLRLSLDDAQLRIRAGRQALHEARSAVIRQLTTHMAHELRNPLGVVRNAVYLLRRRLEKHDLKTDLLDMIDEEIKSADKMITDLTDAVRPREPECAEVDVGEVARDALSRFEASPNLKTSLNVRPDLRFLWCDSRQLRQVLDSVLENSVDSMNGRGEVALTAWRSADSDIIEVRDSGPGIPADALDRVFEPLFTTKRGRCGLGLSRSREILSRHGGRIEVVPQAAPGATVRIILPHRAPVAHEAAAPASGNGSATAVEKALS